MNYVIKLINGDRVTVTDSEYKQILASIKRDQKALVVLPNGEALSPQSISNIVPEDKLGSGIDRTKQLMGVTPEGEQVIKRFGQWYIANPVSPYQIDEQGNSTLKYEGPPLLPTPEEYEAEFKHLAPEAWANRLIGKSSEVDDRLLIDRSGRTTGGKMEAIGSSDVFKRLYPQPLIDNGKPLD